jgi:hypothetical protein
MHTKVVLFLDPPFWISLGGTVKDVSPRLDPRLLPLSPRLPRLLPSLPPGHLRRTGELAEVTADLHLNIDMDNMLPILAPTLKKTLPAPVPVFARTHRQARASFHVLERSRSREAGPICVGKQTKRDAKRWTAQ